MRHPVEGNNIVIIGSGIGGLSAGVLLAALKFHVTVVEKNPLPGGLMNSYRRGGIDCPVGIHYVCALGADEPLGKMFRVLGLGVENLFTPMGQDGAIDRYLFDDFKFDFPQGFDAYQKNLQIAFPQDQDALAVILKNLGDIASRMRDPLFLLDTGDPFANMDYFRSMGALLDELGVSPGLRAVLAVPCMLIGVPLEDCPIILHHMVVGGYLFSSWRPKAAGQALTDAFVSRFEGLGGQLILNDGVESIQMEGGNATGVTLASGKALAADGIVAAIHPKVLLALLPEGALRPALAQRIVELIETDGVLAVHAAVDARAHAALSHNLYRLHADENGIIHDGVFYQIQRGPDPHVNLLSIITRSLYSEWLPWEHTRTGKRGRDYDDKKMALARKLLAEAESVFGALTDARILDVFTPLTVRDYVNCPEGACYGVLRSTGQLMKAASVGNLPIGGLCLAGQSAMAPGALGTVLGSFAAVRQILGRERFMAEYRPQL